MKDNCILIKKSEYVEFLNLKERFKNENHIIINITYDNGWDIRVNQYKQYEENYSFDISNDLKKQISRILELHKQKSEYNYTKLYWELLYDILPDLLYKILFSPIKIFKLRNRLKLYKSNIPLHKFETINYIFKLYKE